MTIGDGLLTYLKTVSAITDIVGTGDNARIRPGRLSRSDSFPAIRYAFVSGDSVAHLTGGSGIAQPLLQVDCYATTYSGANALAEQVRLALQSYRGLMGTDFVNGVTLVNRRELYEDPIDASDVGKHRVLIEFSVTHVEQAASP